MRAVPRPGRLRALAGLLAVLGFAPSLRADDPSDPSIAMESMAGRLAKVEAREFLKKNAWFRDLDKAKAEAARTGKFIFGFFVRSYSP